MSIGAKHDKANGDAERCAVLLDRLGIAAPDEVQSVEPLTGGISSDIYRVTVPGRSICVKFPRERLEVEQDWRAPLERSRAEYGWLRFAAQVDERRVPLLLGIDAQSHGFAMAYLPQDAFPNWKVQLLDLRIDIDFAAAVGAAIAAIHARSACDRTALAAHFPNSYFEALRIDPYFRAAGSVFPVAVEQLETISRDLLEARVALMHGDVSPKNILAGPDGPVFLDAETAAFGDPAFDVAFCLTHFVAKMIHLPTGAATLRRAATAFGDAYLGGVDWEDRAAISRRVGALVPALMLARVGGKSRLEYLGADEACRLADAALAMLADPPSSISALLERSGRLHA